MNLRNLVMLAVLPASVIVAAFGGALAVASSTVPPPRTFRLAHKL